MNQQAGFTRREPGDVIHGDDLWVLDSEVSPGKTRESAFIWRAHAQHYRREAVAIKFAPPDDLGQRLGQRELDRLAAIPASNHVVRIRDRATAGDAASGWYAIPWADFGTLTDYYAPAPRRPLVEVLRFALQIVAGLYDAEVAHRDLRPDNLLIYGRTRNGRVPQLKVADWSRSIDHGAPQSPELVPPAQGFAAPQVFDSGLHADARDDLFSIGAIIWWAATGTTYHASQPRLDKLTADMPMSTAELVATLLSERRDDRAPGGSGRRTYLDLTGKRLRHEIESLNAAEADMGRRALVGPGASPPRAQGPALPQRQTPGPVLELTPPGRAVEPERAALETSASDRQQQGELASTIPPPRSARVGAGTRWPRTGGYRVQAMVGERDAVRFAIAALVAVHVVEGAVILHPTGALSIVLVLLGVLAASFGIAVVDRMIADRFLGRARRPVERRPIPTPALVALRVVVGIAAAALTAQALMVQIHQDEIAALRADDARASLTSRLVQVEQDHQRATAALTKRENSITTKIGEIRDRIARVIARTREQAKAAKQPAATTQSIGETAAGQTTNVVPTDATATVKVPEATTAARKPAAATPKRKQCRSTCLQLRGLEGQQDAVKRDRAEHMAAYVSDRAHVLDMIRAAETGVVAGKRGDADTRLMYRYIVQEPPRVVAFGALLLVLLALESAIAVALIARRGR